MGTRREPDWVDELRRRLDRLDVDALLEALERLSPELLDLYARGGRATGPERTELVALLRPPAPRPIGGC